MKQLIRQMMILKYYQMHQNKHQKKEKNQNLKKIVVMKIVILLPYQNQLIERENSMN